MFCRLPGYRSKAPCCRTFLLPTRNRFRMVLLQGKKGSASQRSVVKCHSEAKINSKPAQHSTMIKQHKGIKTWCSCKTWRHQHRGQTVRMRQHTRASRARAPTYTCNQCACTDIHVQPVRVHRHTRATRALAPTYPCNPCACTTPTRATRAFDI